MTQPYDFANILFAGPCNLQCPYCIGRQLPASLKRDNLHEFPLKNLGRFVELIRRHHITEVTFTGTTTDPQLYAHETRLLAWLRENLPAEVRFSLHTNGRLALQKMEAFNLYQRVTISFPIVQSKNVPKANGRGLRAKPGRNCAAGYGAGEDFGGTHPGQRR